MEEPEFIDIEELRVKGAESFPSVGKYIKKYIVKDLKEKNIIYQREYRILFISSFDDINEKCICWTAEHVRIPGIKIRLFHRKDCAFEPPLYESYDRDGILMTFAQVIPSNPTKNPLKNMRGFFSVYFAINGRSPINRERLTASANLRWFFDVIPVRLRETIRAFGFKNFFKISVSL